MKASELRIGNIIKDDRKAKEWRFVTHRIISDLASNPDVDLYHAIPLTEEWLIKFGFYRNNNAWQLNKKLGYSSSDFSIWNPKGDSEFTMNDTVMCPKIEYVHQLQNLFYALCGEELTIKE